MSHRRTVAFVAKAFTVLLFTLALAPAAASAQNPTGESQRITSGTVSGTAVWRKATDGTGRYVLVLRSSSGRETGSRMLGGTAFWTWLRPQLPTVTAPTSAQGTSERLTKKTMRGAGRYRWVSGSTTRKTLTITTSAGTEVGHRVTGDAAFWAWVRARIDVTYPQPAPAPVPPITTEPVADEPVATEPAPTEPAPTEPAPTEPAPTEPVATEPVTTAPAPTAKITTWRAPGSAPLSDADAAARVRPAAEIRPVNATANATKPTATQLQALRGERDRYGRTAVDYNPLMARVTGDFTGTTDEIIQWGAWKWGIPEDIIRAQAVTESWWRMSAVGDRKTVADPLRYPLHSRITGTSDVYQSLGIMQVKWDHPDVNASGIGSEPARFTSTAFNVDYALASMRYYFDGMCSWCGTGYAAGQEWESIGGWFSPYPWKNSGQIDYIGKVRQHVTDRTWEKAGF